MINVKQKNSIHKNCNTRPNYNIKKLNTGLYCSLHKKKGMVDVINKTCIHPECNKQPAFNYENLKNRLYCSLHKLEDMINIASKTCFHEDCQKQPAYNAEKESKALYCSLHKKPDMVNVISKTCKNDWCSTQVTYKNEGYCMFCFINMFPDKPVSRNYKTKEQYVVEFIKTAFPVFTWVCDKRVQDGCSRRRPDLLLDLGYQILIVEVDENQHIDYDCSCENKRIMEISQDLGHRPIIFIRFNPDDYTHGEITVTSCWGINKNGICVIQKNKK